MKLFLQLIIVSSVVFAYASGMTDELSGKTQAYQQIDTDVDMKDAGDIKREQESGETRIQQFCTQLKVDPSKWRRSVHDNGDANSSLWYGAGRDYRCDVKEVIRAFEKGADPNTWCYGCHSGKDFPIWCAFRRIFKAPDKETYEKCKQTFFLLSLHPEIDLGFMGIICYQVFMCASGWQQRAQTCPFLYCAVFESSHSEFCVEDNFEIVDWLLNHPKMNKNGKISYARDGALKDLTVLHFMVGMRADFGTPGYLGLVERVINSPGFEINAKAHYTYADGCGRTTYYWHAEERARRNRDVACADLIKKHRNFSNPNPGEQKRIKEESCVVS